MSQRRVLSFLAHSPLPDVSGGSLSQLPRVIPTAHSQGGGGSEVLLLASNSKIHELREVTQPFVASVSPPAMSCTPEPECQLVSGCFGDWS